MTSDLLINVRTREKDILKNISRTIFSLFIVLETGNLAALPSASEPVAMIENITNGPDRLSNFDYLYPGRIIDLGHNSVLSLIYFQTCLRENIRGGIVTIQDGESDVEGSIRIS